jgi:hypothetical protein
MKPEINSQLTPLNPHQKLLGQAKLTSLLYRDELPQPPHKTEEKVSIWEIFRRRMLLILGVSAAATTAAFSLTLNQVNEY